MWIIIESMWWWCNVMISNVKANKREIVNICKWKIEEEQRSEIHNIIW